jgi:hypothetical protein
MKASLNALAAAALVAVLASGPAALATQPIGPTLQGQVNAVSGIEAITVNGTQYNVKPGSQAAQALPSLAPGQQVTVMLDGPASSATTHVVAVYATTPAASPPAPAQH